MKRITTLIVAGLVAAALAGCSSPTAANKTNFARDINASLARSCAALEPGTGLSYGESYPLTVPYAHNWATPAQQAAAKAAAQAGKTDEFVQLDALVQAGLLTRRETTIKGYFEGARIIYDQEPARVYSLTAVGRKYLEREAGASLAFCAGRETVDRVIRYTTPTPDEGMTVSTALYTYRITHVAAWARSPAMRAAFPALAHDLAEPHENSVMLVSKSDGWHVIQ